MLLHPRHGDCERLRGSHGWTSSEHLNWIELAAGPMRSRASAATALGFGSVR